MRPSDIFRARAWVSALVFALALAVASGGCTADGDIGFVFGEPTGISYKWETGAGELFVVGGGYNLEEKAVHVHIDWIFHEAPIGMTDWEYYIGLGGRITGKTMGPRLPLGVLIEFVNANMEVFLELAPGLDLGGAGGTLDAAAGFRFYL